MKKTKLHVSIDIEFTTDYAQEDTKVVAQYITQSLENFISDRLRGSSLSTFELGAWSINVKAEETSKKHIQVQVSKVTPSANINAYYSSDGPAFTIIFDKEDVALDFTMQDINAALREAFHKYITKIQDSG